MTAANAGNERDYVIAADLVGVDADARRRGNDLGSKKVLSYDALAREEREVLNDLCDLSGREWQGAHGKTQPGKWTVRWWILEAKTGRLVHDGELHYYVEHQDYPAFSQALNEIFSRRGYSPH